MLPVRTQLIVSLDRSSPRAIIRGRIRASWRNDLAKYLNLACLLCMYVPWEILQSACAIFDKSCRSRGEAPERRLKGEAPERRSKGEAPEHGSKGEAPKRGLKGKAPERGSRGEAPRACVERRSPRAWVERRSPRA
jgi:hypothetical protein